MEFSNSQQVGEELLNHIEFDLVLSLIDNYSSCSFLIQKFHIQGIRKIAFSTRKKMINPERKKNLDIYKKQNFEIIPLNKKVPHGDEISKMLVNFVKKVSQPVYHILVDYTCMNSGILSSLLHAINDLDSHPDELNIYFSFCPTKYRKIRRLRSHKFSLKDTTLAGISTSKPRALILGLGTEEGEALQIVNALNPQRVILMIADPFADVEYVLAAYETNDYLIRNTNSRDIFTYPVQNSDTIRNILTEIIVDLRLHFNVLIVSCGPKIFALNAIMLATRYPDIKVLSAVSSERKIKAPIFNECSGIMIQKIIFENTEDS